MNANGNAVDSKLYGSVTINDELKPKYKGDVANVANLNFVSAVTPTIKVNGTTALTFSAYPVALGVTKVVPSVAVDVAALKTDFNTLLVALRAAGVLTTAVV